jgi:iron complex outermembrane receptor protein
VGKGEHSPLAIRHIGQRSMQFHVMMPAALLLLFVVAALTHAEETPTAKKIPTDLTNLSLEQLANIEVTTVSRRPEELSKVAAPIYVITGEDIRRSGVTSLPEALRLSPGVQVARIDSNKWAIGVRGFTSRLSRSVLVLLDGRSVYTPLFAGVYWEVQDTLLEDIDRIEVVRGPSGTLWGTHATNGVISVITKSARETQGLLATTGGGNFEQGFSGVRYGGQIGTDIYYRVYGKLFTRGPAFHADQNNFDDWRMGQTGFRADWNGGDNNTYKLQGDFYVGEAGQRESFTTLNPPALTLIQANSHLSGGNVLGRWGHKLKGTSELAVQAYYDRTNHHEPTFQEVRDTFTLECTHGFMLGRAHNVNWGLTYELTSGDFSGVTAIAFLPSRRTDQLFSAFIQDEIALVRDRVKLTLASRFDHNDYSGFEIQPSARLLWQFASRQAFWFSLSRAVRTPSRIEHDVAITALLAPLPPTFARLIGDRDFKSEKLLALDAGYRIVPSTNLTIDVSTFYDHYDDLLSLELGNLFSEAFPPPTRFVLPIYTRNGMKAKNVGAEVAAAWQPISRWRLSGAYSYLHINLTPKPGSGDTTTEQSTEGSSPQHQFSLRSGLDLPGETALDISLRYVGELPAQSVPRYVTADMRLGWRPTQHLEVGLVAQNLLQPHHLEFGGGQPDSAQVRRSAYAQVTWRW